MLLFNTDFAPFTAVCIAFKNILCYCLTDADIRNEEVFVKFKNILCYCLTLCDRPGLRIVSKFKNILCYCLTAAPSGTVSDIFYLKTSYVIV